MSVYNGARFLRQAIDSVLGQTMSDFELLIVDDGSVDGTAAILASYSDDRIRVVRQDNCGLAASLNRGLQLARCDMVARMDADDLSVPTRLEVQFAEYERLGRPHVLGGAVELISASGHCLGRRAFPTEHVRIVQELISGHCPLAHPTVLFQRDAVLNCGGYDTFYRTSTEDYDLWLRMFPVCRFANTPHVLLRLRLNPSGMQSRRVMCRDMADSPAWYHCVAHQRYRLGEEGYAHLWTDQWARDTLLRLLRLRVARSGILEASMVARSLSLIHADLLSPGHRYAGLCRLVALCAAHPPTVLRYLLTRRLPTVRYLSSADILGNQHLVR